MSKLRLDLAELRAESFDTAGARPAARGTVKAHVAPTNYASCWCTGSPALCGPALTDVSCQSDIITCPMLDSEQGSCPGDACHYSDAHTCDTQCTDCRTCNFCP